MRESDDLGGAQRLAVMAVDFSRWSRRSFEDVGASLRRAAAIASCVRRSRSTARTTRGGGAALQKRFCASADRATSGRALAGVDKHPDRSTICFAPARVLVTWQLSVSLDVPALLRQ